MSVEASGAASPLRRGRLYAATAFAGAGTMIVELSAVRLLAPWFGTSHVVWTNVIGVVLLALSLGYLLGARLSLRPQPTRLLSFTLGAAAVSCAWIPFFVSPVAGIFLPEGTTLEDASELLAWGSLAASLVLFLIPAFLLGTVAPLAVEAIQRTGAAAGTAGGLVLATSTAGSLAGVFLTSHVLLPDVGLRGTFLISAGGLLLAAALASGARANRGGAARVGALALLGGLGALPASEERHLPSGWERLAQEESAYQSVRVVQSDLGLRYLQVNEVSDSYQSVWQAEPGLLPEGYYYNAFALPPMLEAPGDRWDLLVLGLGAGTAFRVLEGTLPEGTRLHATGVELDPVVAALAQEHLGLTPGPERRVLAGMDARVALGLLGPASFDEIILDAYANQIEIPPHLSSREFFVEMRSHLRPGGWALVNVGSFGLDDPVLRSVGETLASAFEARVLALRVPRARNHVLIVRAGAEVPEPGAADWTPSEALRRVFAGAVTLPRSWSWFDPDPDADVLTDDRNPIDRIQLESLQRATASHHGAEV